MPLRSPSRPGAIRSGRRVAVALPLAAALALGASGTALGQGPVSSRGGGPTGGEPVASLLPAVSPGRAQLVGVVRARDTGLPVAGAHVEVVDAGVAARTDAEGRFRLPRLAAGPHRVRARHLGFRPAEVAGEARVSGGEELAVLLDRAPTPLASVVVSPGQYGVMRQGATAARSLTREQLTSAPQVGEDLFRVVSRLPGVAASDFSAAFRLRGAAPEELLVTLDGVQLHEPFHLKDFDGALSIVDLGAVGGLDLNAGGFGARHGDRLAGVMEVHSLEPEAGAPVTEAALTLTTLRGTSRGRFAGDRGGWLLSARRGFLEYALRMAGEGRDVAPRYYDVFGKVTFQPAPGHDVALHLLHADDRMHYADPIEPTLKSAYGSDYLWGSWRARFGGRLEARTVASVARLGWSRDGERISGLDSVVDLTVRDRRGFTALALRQDWSFAQSSHALLAWGWSAQRQRATYDYARGRRQLGESGPHLLAWRDSLRVALEPVGTIAGAYLTQRLRPLDALTVELGLRADRYTARHAHDYDLEHVVSPRASLAWSLGDGATARAAWGRYAQPQGVHELQAGDGHTALHRADLAEHRMVGLEQLFPGGTTVRLEAYDRRHDRVRPRHMGVDNTLELFPETGPDRQRVAPVESRARGVEFLLAHDAGGPVNWSVSYALAKAEDHLATGRVARPLDQRHTIATDVSVRPSAAWRVSLAGVYHSGWPTTGFDLVRDTLAGQVVLVSRDFGPRNADRLGAYYRLDARVTRQFEVGGGRLSTFVDVFNLLDRRNPRVTDPAVRENFGRHFDTLLPRVPSFGVSWEF